jgi:hypothetical protein
MACAAPATVTVPEAGFAVYPPTDPTVYWNGPFGSLNVIALLVELSVAPFRLTDQLVPVGSPVSVNVTAYVVGPCAVNVTDCTTPAPVTVIVPDDGFTV